VTELGGEVKQFIEVCRWHMRKRSGRVFTVRLGEQSCACSLDMDESDGIGKEDLFVSWLEQARGVAKRERVHQRERMRRTPSISCLWQGRGW
jgi:hypothetical protein